MFNPLALKERSDAPLSMVLNVSSSQLPGSASDTPNFGLIIAYDVLYFVDLILILLLIFTAWFSQIRRTSTWYAALSTTIISATANLLLLGQQRGVGPSAGSNLCLVQAALIHSVAVLDGLYSLSFILQTYMTLRCAIESQPNVPHKYTVALHAVPCISFTGAFVGFLSYGLRNPLTPQRSPTGMYCHISSPGPEISGAIAIVAMVLIVGVEALIIIALRRISGSLKSLFQNDSYIAPDALIRVVIFCIGPFLAIVVSGAQYFDKTDAQTANLSIVLALVPIFIVVVFGSQKDILRVWMAFCRHGPAL